MEYETGRPRAYSNQSAPMRRNTVHMTVWHERIARAVARRNGLVGVSAGARIALEKISQDMPPDLLPAPKKRSK